jgi:hypothetical protein
MVSIIPNKAIISATVLSIEDAKDGYGSYAEISIQSIQDVPGFPNMVRGLEGKTIRAFASPPIAKRLARDGVYSGGIECRRETSFVLTT